MSGEQAVAHALDAIRRVYEEAAAIIEQIPDPQEAFDRADELADGIRQVYDEQATKLRASQVARIWNSEKMTLGELASRMSRSQPRSRQRAHQLLQAALDARKE